MEQKRKSISVRHSIMSMLMLLNAIILRASYTNNEKWYWGLAVAVPLLAILVGRERRSKKNYHNSN